MDADEAAAMADIFLQGFFFFGPKTFPVGSEEDEGCIFAQDLWAEPGGVGGAIDGKAVWAPSWRMAAMPVLMLA
jgi:hypothetical protein